MFAIVGVTVLLQSPASAQSVEAFYRGRQINLLIGGGAGGGYDAYYRALARHIGKHIPGQPSIIPRNQPAASGLAAAAALYTTVDKDGATIGAFPNNVPMDPLFGHPGARYDALKLNWIGSIGKLQNVCATWHLSPIKTIEQAREREVIVAAAAAPTNTAIMPRVLNALIGTKFKPIIGYDPGAGLTMSIERREAEGICGLSWSTMKASRPHWIKEKLLNVIVQMGLDKLARPAGRAGGARSRQRSGEEAGADAHPDPAGAGPAGRCAARRARRARRRAAARFRPHHEGSGVRGRGREAAARDRAAQCHRDGAAAGERLRNAEADRAAGGGAAGAGEVEIAAGKRAALTAP